MSKREKMLFAVVFFFSLLFSIIELIGISAFIPLITMITNPEWINVNHYLGYIYKLFKFTSSMQFIRVFGLAVVFFYIARGAYSLFYNYIVYRFSYNRKHVFAAKLFENYMGLPYLSFVKKNSSEMSKAIVIETYYLAFILNQLLFFMSEFILFFFLYCLMLLSNCQITIMASIFIGSIVLISSKVTSKKIKWHGSRREELAGQLFKIINESMNNFKIIKLFPDSQKVTERVNIINSNLSREFINHNMLLIITKNLLETLGFVVLISIVMYLYMEWDDTRAIIPLISTFVLALYRMLPAANKIVGHYNNMLYGYKSLDLIYNELQHPIPLEGNKNIDYKKNIQFNNVSFGYEDNNKHILHKVSLKICKGSKIGVIGESGSGKSTFINLVIGLIKPSEGEIMIDGITITDENIKSWRQRIGYIPQEIYLFDGNVAENVSFGHAYDNNKIFKCLKSANLHDFLSKNNGLETPVGENGVLLSGGQKQRIGIARALYGDPEILIFDEATSALDLETENKIVEEIFSIGKDKTLIIVAHRPSMIRNCDVVYKLENGNLISLAEQLLD